MLDFVRQHISLKITLALVAIVTLILLFFSWLILKERSGALEEMLLSKGRAMAIVGAREVEKTLENALAQGLLTEEQIFDTDYRPVTEGELSRSGLPRFHTAYDTFLDRNLRHFLDAFLEDSMVVFAVAVDRNGYLPTHNSRYNRPLTGDPSKDRNLNRTKRIFNDPVGLSAARFEGGTPDILRQVYARDTGEVMWDIASPVTVSGRHWGAFRIGFSMQQMQEALGNLQKTVLGLSLTTLLVICATIHVVVRRLTAPLADITEAVRRSRGGKMRPIDAPDSTDEVGTLVRAFNGMVADLQRTTVSKREMDNLVDSMHEALFVLDPTGRILRVNRASTQLLQQSAGEILFKPITSFLDPGTPHEELAEMLNLGGENQVYDRYFRTEAGELFPVSVSVARLRGKENPNAALIWLVQDVSQQRQAARKVLESKRFLETVLNSMDDAISILDARSFEILGCNRSFLDRAGCEEEKDVLGRTCYDVTHHGTKCWEAGENCPLIESRATGEKATCQHIHIDRAGWEDHIQIITCPIFDDHGEVEKIVHISRDITEQKNAETELRISSQLLEESNRELLAKTSELEEAYESLKGSQMTIMQQEKMASIGQLAAGVAHEINNPIGFISSNLRTLAKYRTNLFSYLESQEEALEPSQRQGLKEKRQGLKIDYLREDIADLIDESLEGAERVRQIVSSLKSFSRVDQAEQSMADLNECMESTINIVWNELKYKVSLERDYGELPRTFCYPQQLNQVFMNLLVNAAQAIEKQGIIKVTTRHREDKILIRVQDNGCGIAAENLNRLFEPFFTTKEVGKGTGLGLSIAYDIIRKHGGEMEVESEPGKGTTFTLCLPLQDEPRDEDLSREDGGSPPSPSPGHC